MTNMATWLAALATMAILVVLAFGHRRRPGQLARTAHAALREEWFEAVSAQKGSGILAVQTLRNSLMSATMTASTAVLALMGTVSRLCALCVAAQADTARPPAWTAPPSERRTSWHA